MPFCAQNFRLSPLRTEKVTGTIQKIGWCLSPFYYFFWNNFVRFGLGANITNTINPKYNGYFNNSLVEIPNKYGIPTKVDNTPIRNIINDIFLNIISSYSQTNYTNLSIISKLLLVSGTNIMIIIL